jgi:hypothetical protein
MPEQYAHRTLDSLKKEAKRWLAALRVNDPDARARLERAISEIPGVPTLRHIQLALAREHGFSGWAALKKSLESRAEAGGEALERYNAMVDALLDAYRSGTPEAMERHYQFTWHRRSWQVMRTYVQLDLGKRPSAPGDDVEISLDDARYLVAREHGFSTWNDLRRFAATASEASLKTAKPIRLVAYKPEEDGRPLASSRDWDSVVELLATYPSAALHADGQMTDEALERVSRAAGVRALHMGGSKALTDAGLRHLARLPMLEHLDLSGTAITDAGLAVFRQLPALRTISLAMTAVSDAGVAHLAPCHALERVHLAWTRTGDAAIKALAGKQKLAHFFSGAFVTNAGIPILHEWPVFKSWRGGETKVALLSPRSSPNNLALRGSFTDAGMQHVRGLDGLFGLNLDDSNLLITAAALPPLASLTNLGWLSVDAKDDWMPHIARMPRLIYLGAQDTTAGDEGFAALSKSQTLQYIWGRRCHNLHTAGFVALAELPALRGLSVSCLNVDELGISALPQFPALRELMPMDIPDVGYRNIGKCDRLESLILMYCRDTTDVATEHITGLRSLSYYFNSYTHITDRTPELLSNMDSLERITFDTCHGLTNRGIANLARLPRLRELRASGRQLSAEAASGFPSNVLVSIDE